tara:strand:+ start:417 stop:1082 length:666 start_codon:yes stop_codon:yes gene_type:complete
MKTKKPLYLVAHPSSHETPRPNTHPPIHHTRIRCRNTVPLPLGSWSDHDLDTAQRSDIRQTFQQGIDQKFIPGGSLMIIHNGEVILQEGFGVASLESGEPFTANAPCRIASLTKPHTATTLALLAGEGKLSFSDPVSKYIPAFKELKVRGKDGAAKPITLAMCLSHTAGFASNNQLKAGKLTLDFNGTLKEVVNELAGHELFYEPATAYGYSINDESTVRN